MPRERRGRVGWESPNPYHEGRKHPEPTVCERCGLVYQGGRWQSKDVVPAGAQRTTCPACRRELDRYPGGFVQLHGTYWPTRKEEILNLVRNQAEEVQRLRPLQGIMWIEPKGQELEIATTSSQLARRLGKAIQSAHKGKLTIHQPEGEPLVRVDWRRDLD